MKLENFLETLNVYDIPRSKIIKDLEVERTIYKRDTNSMTVHLESSKIISHKKLEELRKVFEKKMCPPLKKVVFVLKIKSLNKKKVSSTMKKYMPNIFFHMVRKSPALIAFENKVEYLYLDDVLKIKIPHQMIYENLKTLEIEQSIKDMVFEELGIELIDVILELPKKSSIEREKNSIENIIKKQEAESLAIVENIAKNNPLFLKSKSDIKGVEGEDAINRDEKNIDSSKVQENDSKSSKDKNIDNGLVNNSGKEISDELSARFDNEELDKNLFYGTDLFAQKKNICDIDINQKTVLVEGRIFDTSEVETNHGKIIYTIYLTDNTSAISAKLYLNDLNRDKIMENTKKSSWVIIKGDIKKNYYTNDLELNVTAIKKSKEVERMDESEEKRVELHLHTNMSAMDSVLPVKDAINQAIKWGHKAIGITDHGVVQAYPDAMNASKGKDIKVLYGCEVYLVDDSQDIIVNANDKDFDQAFVVFDIETTGFSPTNDNITEIGAVKIVNGGIVDEFSTFVDPEMDISYKIQELTRITNEMVEGAPKQEEALRSFMEFCKDCVLVAHNADFDTGFISEKCSQYGIEYNHEKIDTLLLSRVLLTKLKRFSLDKVCKELGIVLSGHHRAVNDAAATSRVFMKFVEMMIKDGVKKFSDVNKIYGKVDFKKLRPTHATVFAKNQVGLKTLYKLISEAHINNFYKEPRTLKSLLMENKENLLIGSACSDGELFNAVMRNKSESEIEKILKLYDFIEVMPIQNSKHLIEGGEVKDENEIISINKKLIALGEKYDKLVVATGDVHMMNDYQYINRDILMYCNGKPRMDQNKELYFKTTEEMLKCFDYLDEDKAKEIVITNTNKIADMLDDVKPIPSDTYPPIIEGSDEELRQMCFDKAERIYGTPLPEIVEHRLNKELNSIIGNGYAVMYIIANKLVAKSLSDGYLVGSRGSVGSSFAATMSDITEVNPLPAHYICPNPECKHSHFFKIGEYGSGVDLEDKDCEKCGTRMIKEGHDIPFEVFLGFEGDKEPDIDLNFSGEYQSEIHKYTEELFGEGYTYRAGTIGTVKDKTAYGYVKKFNEEIELELSSGAIKWLTDGCTGVKKTSGQHPGGVMVIPNYKEVYDFTPIQYPANDSSSGVQTTHFDYHSISGRILKLDILGHDGPTILKMLEDFTGLDVTKIPLDDPETMSIFLNTEALGVTPEEIGSEVGCIGIPEFGTKFTRQMLVDTKPTTFAELVRIAGLSHGTDVWLNNAQSLVRSNIVTLKEVISTRDDIMNYLIFSNLQPKMAFTIMESVRKGKGLKPEHEEAMIENNVPSWYINSCKKIKYMFPKAHAVAYVMTSFRIAYCKVHHPEAFYATYFTTKVEDFDIELITSGIDNVKRRMKEIEELGYAASAKEKSQYTILEVVVEMYARKIEFEKIDIYKSDAKRFMITEDKKILPPMTSLQGMGENAALSIVEARKDGEFKSKKDLLDRTKLTKTVVEKLTAHGSLDGMSETNQLSFFDIMTDI